MSKKDYVQIANLIHEQIQAAEQERLDAHANTRAMQEIRSMGEVHGLTKIAHSLANLCQTDNPNFDRDRFLIACGVKR